MSADAARFAQLVLDAFDRRGLTTDSKVAGAGGPSTTTMTKLRKVAAGTEGMATPREPTWSKIESAANWQPGSAEAVWNGGLPIGCNLEGVSVNATAGSPGSMTLSELSQEVHYLSRRLGALSQELLRRHGRDYSEETLDVRIGAVTRGELSRDDLRILAEQDAEFERQFGVSREESRTAAIADYSAVTLQTARHGSGGLRGQLSAIDNAGEESQDLDDWSGA